MIAHVRDIAKEPDVAKLIQLVMAYGLDLHIFLNVFQVPVGSGKGRETRSREGDLGR